MPSVFVRYAGAGACMAVVACLACGAITGSGASTPQEFVENYSRAYRSGNVGDVVEMTLLQDGQTEETFREEVKRDIGSRGFGYVAWAHTRYVSHEDRGDYIRVEVEVHYARSSIVLVRRDGLLKVVQDPSEYEQNAP